MDLKVQEGTCLIQITPLPYSNYIPINDQNHNFPSYNVDRKDPI